MTDTIPSIKDTWDLRQPERQLLLGCLTCILLGFLMVLGSGHNNGHIVTASDLSPLLIYAASLIVVHMVLVSSGFRGDQILPGVLAFLSGFGVLIQFRMGSFELEGPLKLSNYIFPASIITMLSLIVLLRQNRYHLLAKGVWFWGILSLLLVATLLITGERFRGGIYAAGFTTPTEILKVTIVLFLAGFINNNLKGLSNWGHKIPLPPLKALLPLILFWACLGTLLLLQRDLGMFVILSIALVAMLFIATGQLSCIIYGVLGAAGASYLSVHLFLHGQHRIQAWQDPFLDPTGTGWQILQGLSGMYSGGLWGEGFGNGNPEYTPIAESDFIYTVIGEELGFIGCTLVVVFFLIFFSSGFRIAHQCRSSYGSLLCAGLTSVLATQTFLNIGGVIKFIPLTGITLPFISHGGSSLLTTFISLSLIMVISEDGPIPTRSQRGNSNSRRKTSGVTARQRPRKAASTANISAAATTGKNKTVAKTTKRGRK